MESRIQRAVLHLEHVLRSALYVFCDLMAMSWAEEERAQNQHIEGALQELGSVGRLFRSHDSRPSTLTRVDVRPSLRLAESQVALAGIWILGLRTGAAIALPPVDGLLFPYRIGEELPTKRALCETWARMSHPDPNGAPDRRPIKVGEVWENPVAGERSVILERPWNNPASRVTGELTALVGARVSAR